MRNLVAAALLLTAFSTTAFSEETIKISGGAAPMENVFKRIKDAFEKSSGMKLELSESGPDKALEELSQGKIDLASAGLAKKDWFDLMKEKGKPISNESEFNDQIVGRDRIAIIMHTGLKSIKELSDEKVNGIFTGKIKNWKEVGGPDLAITLIYGKKITGTNKLWKAQAMGGAEWGSNKVEVETASDVMAKVASTPGAVGIGPTASSNAGIYMPESSDVSRPITVFTKGKPSPKVEKLLAFIKGEGSKLIAR